MATIGHGPAIGFWIGTTTVLRYIREALDVLAARTLAFDDAIAVAARKAFVIIDGTLLSIDRVGMTSGQDRPFTPENTNAMA